MRVTFLIGNGFDLNLGLKTRYTDFYERYIRDASFSAKDDSEIKSFKKNFDPNVDSYPDWADFELALGSHTFDAPLNSEASLRKCLQHFKHSFAQYLRAQERRINFDACGREMASTFWEDLHSYPLLQKHNPDDLFAPNGRRAERIPLPDSTVYNILDFNYTTIIDRLIPYLSSDRRSSLHQVIHVHGTHSSGMIMGVDNIRQVANPRLFTKSRQRRLLVKPLLNQQYDPVRDQEAWNCIKSSDEICIFGMSLGATDSTWWRRIGQWLSKSSYHRLVIFSQNHREPGQLLEDPEDIVDRQERLQDRFLHNASLSPCCRRVCRNRVCVEVTSDLFNLSPILDSVPPPSPERFRLNPAL